MVDSVDPGFLLAVVFVVAVVGLMVVLFLRERKRREALERVAHDLGLAFERDSSEDLVGLLSGFPLMRQGFGRRAFNVMRGRFGGREVRIFDYVYKTREHNGKQSSTRTHHFSTALAWLPVRSPRVRIVPEGWGHKLWDALGGDDIDFESDEFSRRFWVKADERRAAYDLLHPRAMEHLMTPGWDQWEVLGDVVLQWEVGRLDPAEVRGVLQRLVGFVDLVPVGLPSLSSTRPA